MKNKSCLSGCLDAKAFTLIELLVVVLIIGILAAVALPQYKMAVAKTRLVQLITLSTAVKQAEDRYYLANGLYTKTWDELDIDLNGTVTDDLLYNSSGWRLRLHGGIGKVWGVYAWDSRLPGIILIFGYGTGAFGRKCYALETNDWANKLCKNVTHKNSSGKDGGYNSYKMD